MERCSGGGGEGWKVIKVEGGNCSGGPMVDSP